MATKYVNKIIRYIILLVLLFVGCSQNTDSRILLDRNWTFAIPNPNTVSTNFKNLL